MAYFAPRRNVRNERNEEIGMKCKTVSLRRSDFGSASRCPWPVDFHQPGRFTQTAQGPDLPGRSVMAEDAAAERR